MRWVRGIVLVVMLLLGGGWLLDWAEANTTTTVTTDPLGRLETPTSTKPIGNSRVVPMPPTIVTSPVAPR